MTKEELKNALKDFGSKGKEIADELYKKLESEKETMDTNTRRKTRVFWVVVSVCTFVIGVAVGYLFL
ncbi:hypothetical protein [Parasutterella secunda]|uniref:Uncharacterized protein n=1 Tax=Parasutterella secunda TaxID=626947 RepID=A0ABS2GWW5_9BURK|nr:hypothetical protein [Parasutterella secunda]MBM6929337.1 hypothetical protein [Parasutterella secunda]